MLDDWLGCAPSKGVASEGLRVVLSIRGGTSSWCVCSGLEVLRNLIDGLKDGLERLVLSRIVCSYLVHRRMHGHATQHSASSASASGAENSPHRSWLCAYSDAVPLKSPSVCNP